MVCLLCQWPKINFAAVISDKKEMWSDQREIVQRWLDDYLLINNKMKNTKYINMYYVNKEKENTRSD